jgi:hypothetical protein
MDTNFWQSLFYQISMYLLIIQRSISLTQFQPYEMQYDYKRISCFSLVHKMLKIDKASRLQITCVSCKNHSIWEIHIIKRHITPINNGWTSPSTRAWPLSSWWSDASLSQCTWDALLTPILSDSILPCVYCTCGTEIHEYFWWSISPIVNIQQPSLFQFKSQQTLLHTFQWKKFWVVLLHNHQNYWHPQVLCNLEQRGHLPEIWKQYTVITTSQQLVFGKV